MIDQIATNKEVQVTKAQPVSKDVLAFATASVLFITSGTAWYIYLVLTRNPLMKPVLASWIVIATTMMLSFVTYWTKNQKRSLIANVGNAISVLSTGSIFLAVAYVTVVDHRGLKFNYFQLGSLTAAAAIMAWWYRLVWIRKVTSTLPNVLIQVLMAVGYAVTAEKLWHATHNTEPMFTWICIALGGLCAMYPAFKRHDQLAKLYTVRVAITTTSLIVLMYRAGHH